MHDLPFRDLSPIMVSPTAPEYETVLQAIREHHRQVSGRTANRSVDVVTGWLWQTPASLRAGLLALIADVDGAWSGHIANALSDVLFAQLPVLDSDDQSYTEAQLHAGLCQPTTLAATLVAVSAALGMPVREWLTAEYASALTRAADMGTDSAL